MNDKMKVRLHNGLKESSIGFLLALVYIILKYFYWPDIFIWLAETVFVIFCTVLFFIRGYRKGYSITNFNQEMQKKREEMLNSRFSEDLRCYKCSSIIKPEDNSCPICGWTWKL
ncbi:MAG: hypothetical protein GX654_02980 [Desulfatiglans sp.]|jgi:hypothetical protein|nr:hypothetical protein [Desulfatiglans sp.]